MKKYCNVLYKDASVVFEFLINEAKKHGDIEQHPTLPKFTLWKWENELLAQVHVSVFDRGELLVEFLKMWGDNFVFQNFYRNIVSIGINNGIFDCTLEKHRLVNIPDDETEDLSDSVFNIVFNMCESTNVETRVSGAKALVALYSNNLDAIEYLNKNARMKKVLSSLLRPVPKKIHIRDVECLTVGLIILENTKFIDLAKKLSWLTDTKDVMWAEARRRLLKIQMIK
jgi:hypothetical protein